MRKVLPDVLLKVGVVVLALFMCAGNALAAGKKVLVLPFQVEAGPNMPNASRDVPQQIIDQLKNRGFDPVSLSSARALLRGGEGIDLARARELGRQSGADLVIYGSFNQLGDGFNMDTRLVPVMDGSAVPASFERSSTAALKDCAATLANRTVEILGEPAQAATPTATSLVPMGSAPVSGSGLADVQVRGMQTMDPDTVYMRMTIRKGDKPDANAINEEVKRIWDMGYFSDVQAHMEGNVLVFTVVEKPRIDLVRVEGSNAIDEEDVLAAMGTKAGAVLNEQVIADDLQKIAELYRKDGYYLAKATYRVDQRASTGGHGAVLVVSVDEGKKLYIKEVKVDGIKGINRSDLDKYMALKTRGLFSFLTGSGVLKEEYLERDTNAIAAFGLNQGFVDIQVSAPTVEYKEDGIYITFTVHEGPRYTVRSVKFAGDVIDSEENMHKVVEMDKLARDKSHFELAVMQEDTKRLTDYYADFGYAYAEVDTKLMKAEDGTDQVDVSRRPSGLRKTILLYNSLAHRTTCLRSDFQAPY